MPAIAPGDIKKDADFEATDYTDFTFTTGAAGNIHFVDVLNCEFQILEEHEADWESSIIGTWSKNNWFSGILPSGANMIIRARRVQGPKNNDPRLRFRVN